LFVEAYRTKDAPRLLGALNKILTERPFLLGDTLSVVDIAVGSILAYAPLMLGMKFDEYPAVDAYLKGLTALPSFQNTIGKR
jgi:glutathione S-transferase